MSKINSFSHYVRTPEKSEQLNLILSKSQIQEFVFPELANRILTATPLDNIYAMNVEPGAATLSAAEWLNLKFDDRILLFQNTNLRSSLVCTGKFQSEALAHSLEIVEQRSFSPFFYTFLTEYEFPISKQLTEIENFMALYSDISVPFAQIDPYVETNLWDSINNIFEFSFTESEHSNLRDLTILESLDSHYLAKYRIEQNLLRKHLLSGRRIRECFFCQRIFQAEYLVAAHIKQRSECSLSERLDYDNNVVLACRFGCDFLFELGKFTVLESGIIETNVSKLDQNAYEYICENLTRELLIKDGMKRYINWHNENRFMPNF